MGNNSRTVDETPGFAWRFFKRLLFILLIYILLYVPDSFLGGYWDYPVSGRSEYSFGLSMPTVILWQPLFGYRDQHKKTILGIVFYPLISVDQHYLHRPLDLADTNDSKLLFSTNNLVKWHPKSIKEAESERMKQAAWRSHCVDDPEFCLQSATNFHSRADTHFLALIIADKYGTNSVVKLYSLSSNAESKYAKDQVLRILKEVKTIMDTMGGRNERHEPPNANVAP